MSGEQVPDYYFAFQQFIVDNIETIVQLRLFDFAGINQNSQWQPTLLHGDFRCENVSEKAVAMPASESAVCLIPPARKRSCNLRRSSTATTSSRQR